MKTDAGINSYRTLDINKMTRNEIAHICSEIQIAINWGSLNARVYNKETQQEVLIPIEEQSKWQDAHTNYKD